MNILAQCISGFQDFVAAQLERDGLAQSIDHSEDGLVIFKTACTTKFLLSIDYVSNVFLLIRSKEAASIAEFMALISRDGMWAKGLPTLNARNFRVMVSDEGQLVPADPAAIQGLINAIGKGTRLDWSPRGADAEFWIMRRRGGKIFFCLRLSQRARTEKDLRKGELRPELARLLCLLSEPAASDIFLDPFSGSGALGFARTRTPYNMMFLSDLDPANIKAMKADVKAGLLVREKKGSPLIIRAADALALEKIEDGFIDKIVTDPPWGYFDTEISDLPKFYSAVLSELCRVTKVSGIIVMLLGRREMIGPLSKDFKSELREEARFDILVAGKKAVAVKWRRL